MDEQVPPGKSSYEPGLRNQLVSGGDEGSVPELLLDLYRMLIRASGVHEEFAIEPGRLSKSAIAILEARRSQREYEGSQNTVFQRIRAGIQLTARGPGAVVDWLSMRRSQKR